MFVQSESEKILNIGIRAILLTVMKVRSTFSQKVFFKHNFGKLRHSFQNSVTDRI